MDFQDLDDPTVGFYNFLYNLKIWTTQRLDFNLFMDFKDLEDRLDFQDFYIFQLLK